MQKIKLYSQNKPQILATSLSEIDDIKWDEIAREFRESIPLDQYECQSISVIKININNHNINCKLLVEKNNNQDMCRITIDNIEGVCIDSKKNNN